MLECYKLGVYDFIKKPEELEIMLKRIENGLKIGELIYFHEFIQMELDTARKFQKYLYPEPSMRDNRMHLEVLFRPLSDIGGDFYDYIKFRDGRFLFCVADISGHSISAAMYIAMLKMMFRKAIKEIDKPGDILTRLNREIGENLPVETFVTMFCGLIDPSRQSLVYANAGHPFPFIIKHGQSSPLEGHDQFLGPMKNARFATFDASISDWEGMIIFTDGLLDIGPQNNGNFGLMKLQNAFGESGKTIQEKFNHVIAYLASPDITINDDCTMMLIEFLR
jgi:sigma-B regulation protein RsbU (phosphoserine phosphatase)